jgi:protein O-mannosyl-transferase
MSEATVAVPPDSQRGERPDSTVPSKPPLTRRELTLLIVLGLLAATLLLYRPTLHHFFVNYDDPLYVVENTHVQKGLSWENMRWAFTTTTADNWHPLTWISHMADVQAFGLKPTGHHLDSILWHALNVALLFFLLRAATGYLWRSATVAALFALCPLNVECAAWVAERKSLISTTFLLLALFAYGWYLRRRNVERYLAVVFLFALGLLAKPMIVTLPVLLLLADYWPLQRLSLSRWSEFREALAGLVLEKIPFFVLSAASSAITIYVQKTGGALAPTAVIPIRYRIENAIHSYALYIVKAFWPSRLAAFYPHPGPSLSIWGVVATGAALLAITAIVWLERRRRVFAVCWAWYGVTLLPVIGLIQMGPQGWADRYAYIPLIGIFVGVVWLTADFAEKMHWERSALAVAAVAVLSAYAWVSHVQIGYWSDSYALFSHAIEVTSRNGVAEVNLGITLLEAGQPALAEQHFRAGVEYMPDLPASYYDLGVILQQEGKIDEALQEYRLGLARHQSAPAHNNIGTILLNRGDLPGALAEYNASLRLNPENAHSLLGRGTIEYRWGQYDAALADLNKSAQLSPLPEVYSLIGRVYEAQSKLGMAAKSYQTALGLDPNFAEASSRLAALEQKQTR